MKDKKFYRFCLCYFIYYITYGAFSPYLNVYLENLGFNGTQIGSLNSASLIMGMLFAPLFGVISDKVKSIKLTVGVLLILSGLAMFIFSLQSTYLLVMLTFVILGVFKSDIGSLIDALAVKYTTEEKQNFSHIRTFGSIGYVFGSFILANILAHYGLNGPYIKLVIGCYLITALLLFSLPEGKIEHQDVDLKKDGLALLKNSNFILIIILNSFSMTIIDSINGYVGNHLVKTLALNSTAIGAYTACMVLPEIIVLANANFLFKHFGFKKVYVFSLFTQVLRFLVYALTQNIILFFGVSVLHAFIVIASAVGNVTFLALKIDRKLMGTAMSLYGAANLIVCALYNQIIGILYDMFGSYSMFIMGCILTALATIIAFKTPNLEISSSIIE